MLVISKLKSPWVEESSEGVCNPSDPTEVKTSEFLNLELPVFHIRAALRKSDTMRQKAGATALRGLSCMPNIALSLSSPSTPLPLALTHMPLSKLQLFLNILYGTSMSAHSCIQTFHCSFDSDKLGGK